MSEDIVLRHMIRIGTQVSCSVARIRINQGVVILQFSNKKLSNAMERNNIRGGELFGYLHEKLLFLNKKRFSRSCPLPQKAGPCPTFLLDTLTASQQTVKRIQSQPHTLRPLPNKKGIAKNAPHPSQHHRGKTLYPRSSQANSLWRVQPIHPPRKQRLTLGPRNTNSSSNFRASSRQSHPRSQVSAQARQPVHSHSYNRSHIHPISPQPRQLPFIAEKEAQT